MCMVCATSNCSHSTVPTLRNLPVRIIPVCSDISMQQDSQENNMLGYISQRGYFLGKLLFGLIQLSVEVSPDPH